MSDPRDVDRAETRHARSPGRTFVAILAGALLAAGVLGQLTGPDTTSAQAPLTPQLRSAPAPETRSLGFAGPIDLASGPVEQGSVRLCEVPVGGLVLAAPQQVPGWSIERWGCGALEGPWSMVIREAGGHLGFHSAVVTFPVARAVTGTLTTQPPGGRWDSRGQALVWPLAGSYAQLVGDLGQAKLADLAKGVTVKGGRPHLVAPRGYTASPATTYRAPLVHEMRYSAAILGQGATLGRSLVYTGARTGGSFESEAFRAHATPAGLVRGRPAIGYEVPGRHAALAWEPAPGRVLYIGFNGSTTRTSAIEVLRALAEKGRELTAAQWQTKDRIRFEKPAGWVGSRQELGDSGQHSRLGSQEPDK